MLTVALSTAAGPARPVNELSLRGRAKPARSPVVAQMATHIAVMKAGRFVEIGPADKVL